MKKFKFWSIAGAILFMSILSTGAQDIKSSAIIDTSHYNIFNNLRMYQIMVEAYQDGDSTRDYNEGYGPSSHKGDLRGILNALPYIKSLGINAIWLTPIFDSDGDSKLDATGYFCRNYFKIDPRFGTLQDARNMVNKAHELGIYVFLDGVFGHHKRGVIPSPTGKMPVGGNDPVSYPGSLAFYEEVATYWIDTLEIDGWRLDQCYQVSLKNQDKNYWNDIREVVEKKCLDRKKEGKKWGILGYMVGEDWEDAKDIQVNSYSGNGLRSAFDFPSRYDIVKVLACDSEHDTLSEGASSFSYIFSTPTQKGYVRNGGVYPNLFFDNHDVVRLGNLINWRFHLTRSDEDYWKRYRCALSLLAAYTGPITLYYGDEYGDMLDGYLGPGTSGFANDNVGRSNGKTSGFTDQEKALIKYTSTILNIRKTNPALYSGTRINLISSKDEYADLKTNGSNKIVYSINIGNSDKTLEIKQTLVGGNQLINLEDNTTISSVNGVYTIPIAPLTANFYQVR